MPINSGVIRTAEDAAVLAASYKDGDGSTVPKRFDLRTEQVEMITTFAGRLGETQITVLRKIVDEWRRDRLAEAMSSHEAESEVAA